MWCTQLREGTSIQAVGNLINNKEKPLLNRKLAYNGISELNKSTVFASG